MNGEFIYLQRPNAVWHGDGYDKLNPLSANPTKWPNTLKQFVGKLPTNCLSMFGHFVNLAPKRLSLMDFQYMGVLVPEKSFVVTGLPQ